VKVAVTGSAGRLARALLPRLCAHPQVAAVTGIDLLPAGFTHTKYREHRLDIRSPDVGAALAGHDALVHLAFVVMRGSLGRRRRDRELVRAIDVGGSTNVLGAAVRAGLAQLVHLSSAAVYGPWPGNPARITEDQPLQPMPGFAYAEDKAAVEAWLEGLEASHPGLRIARLRPHVILGPNAHPLLLFLLRQPFYPRLPDPQPLTQCVWEDDVADAILSALLRGVRGAYNLAAEPALSFRTMQRLVHRRTFPLPFGLTRSLQRALWQVTGAAGDPGWVEALGCSLALDCRRAHRELDWHPRLTVYDCLKRVSGTVYGRRDTVQESQAGSEAQRQHTLQERLSPMGAGEEPAFRRQTGAPGDPLPLQPVRRDHDENELGGSTPRSPR
jgi:UDP-glucose 4-epimerase